MRLFYLFLSLLIALGMALTQHYAFMHHWYWTYWWLDWVMHFAGGAVIALIAGAYLGVGPRVVALTLLIGLMWEVYEFVIGISRTEPNFVSDTLSDLSMDVFGAACAYGMMRVWEMCVSPLSAARGASPDQTSSSP